MECAFLRKYGKPKEIADDCMENHPFQRTMPFECSLCRLCEAVCPVDAKPADMFAQLRRASADLDPGAVARHSILLNYEKRGTSPRYSHYAIPGDCHTVFFPGCALPGARPKATWRLIEHLKTLIPSIGVVLDCCTKPSHDLGRHSDFEAMFGELKGILTVNGVGKVLVACPSCYAIFRDYGEPLQVETIYEFIAANGAPAATGVRGTVSVHDPCATRFESPIHDAVRELVAAKGLTIEQMPHEREKTLCCGEGGAVRFIAPDLAKQWSIKRGTEADGQRLITYCAGCVYSLGALTATSHLLDLLFEPAATMSGSIKASKAPMTYLNRLWLKNRIAKSFEAGAPLDKKPARKQAQPKHSFWRRLSIRD